jgi:OOP family OmpA-OmpF porin
MSEWPRGLSDTAWTVRRVAGNPNRLPFLRADLGLELRPFNPRQYVLSPYGFMLFSGGFRNNVYPLSLPMGIGVDVRLAPRLWFNLESQYRLRLSNNLAPALLHQAGLVWSLRKAGKPEPVPSSSPSPVPLPPLQVVAIPGDRDNDGVPDLEDACPDAPGKRLAKGCPDSDGDGFRDDEDQCPQDKGVARYRGCPVPDRDNDGFDDEVDQCPDEPFEDNNGCPYVKKEIRQKVDLAAKGIRFARSSAVIDSASFANLDEIAGIMFAQPAFVLDIEGHTDSRGGAELNLRLSQERADACKNYLVNKGISDSRIESVGYGDMHPIGDNNTDEGRAMNRRTEFRLKWTE